MTPFDQILDAVERACKTVAAFNQHVYVERQAKLDVELMPGAIVWPGPLVTSRLGHDASASRFSFRVDVFAAGERPSRQFYLLASAVHAALCDSPDLPRLIAELPEPSLDEPIYGDFSGFAGYLPIRYTVTVVTGRRDLSVVA